MRIKNILCTTREKEINKFKINMKDDNDLH